MTNQINIYKSVRMKLSSLNNCQLAIGRYPRFIYNAHGGGGLGEIRSTAKLDYKEIFFKPESFVIPYS